MLDHDPYRDDAHHDHAALDACIAECRDCHATCLAAAADEEGGDGDVIGLLLDCAQMCETAADFMLRRSPLHGYSCGLCAHICRVCADRCRTAGIVDCADACARCADACLRMSKQAAHEMLT